ncbi:MAG: MalM family protein [Tolumonas sp.]
MMKARLIFLTVLTLAGCANQSGIKQQPDIDNSAEARQALTQATICCTDFSSVTMQQLHNGIIAIDASSPVMQFASGRSAFYAGAIPAEYYGADVTAASLVGKTAMPLQVMLLDAQRNPTRTLDETAFPFIEATLFSSNRFSGKIRLLPNERFMVIYANTADLQRKLTLPHPEKLKARAKNIAPPPYPDLQIPYSPWGTVELKFSNPVAPMSVTETVIQPTAATSHVSATPVKAEPSVQTTTVSQQTRLYYQQAIQQAVRDNQIELAMQLVAEAEKLGFTEARNVFVEAVKQK